MPNHIRDIKRSPFSRDGYATIVIMIKTSRARKRLEGDMFLLDPGRTHAQEFIQGYPTACSNYKTKKWVCPCKQ
jgi:hypothetical protein